MPDTAATQSARPGRAGRHRRWLWAAGIALTIAGLAALATLGSMGPVLAWMASFRGWIEGLGVWGLAAFALIYVAATLAMAPCAPLALVAGLAWGIWGFPLVIASALTGSAMAFQIGRRVAQARVRAWTDTHPRGAAVIEAVSDQGWKIVLLLRLSPIIPFNVQNYLFGITDIRFLPFLAATVIGLLPGSSLFIAIGAFGHGADDAEGRILNWVLFGVGLAATVAAAALVTRQVMKKLRGLDGSKSGSRSAIG